MLRVAANPEPSINPQTRNKRDDRLAEGPGRVARTGRVLRRMPSPYTILAVVLLGNLVHRDTIN